MSVLADFLSWANLEPDRFVKNPEDADTIVVLGCQVTDLAVLNDLRNVEQLHADYNKPVYLGGCIALRFDIEVPNYVNRLGVVRSVETPIKNKSLVDFAKPFWVKNFKENEDNLSDGNLFRNMYPLKIGAGCTGHCKYCTIRFTRGIAYERNAYDQIDEFLDNENVVLISDSPTAKQIEDWCNIAVENKKQISIRNVEPHVVMATYEHLLNAAKNGVLKILHSPIQSCMSDVLKAMGRNSQSTIDFILKVKELRSHGVIVATNIIIDYEVNGEIINNMNDDFMKSTFDYYVWNPYWNGEWNRERAEERFKKYIG
jgi:tRNA A37 methylthiotransferase MiaB